MCMGKPKVPAPPPPPPPVEVIKEEREEAEKVEKEEKRKVLATAQGRTSTYNPITGSLGVINPYVGANANSLF